MSQSDPFRASPLALEPKRRAILPWGTEFLATSLILFSIDLFLFVIFAMPYITYHAAKVIIYFDNPNNMNKKSGTCMDSTFLFVLFKLPHNLLRCISSLDDDDTTGRCIYFTTREVEVADRRITIGPDTRNGCGTKLEGLLCTPL